AEAVVCSPKRWDSDQVICRPLPESAASADGSGTHIKALQLHAAEEGLQPEGNLPETVKISGWLEATKVQEKANTSLDSETQMEKERVTGSQNVQTAREPVPAGQEKPSDMPLPSEGTA
ncbi:PSD3 protein, partial [Dromaius novaehollandiae]|nr:PSD3 protein [Dromaius novaehollandiae]NXG39979.1 PSD3 protein [Dromaius novaehollandiae]